MALLVDAQISFRLAQAIEALGIAAEHVDALALGSASDGAVMSAARTSGRIVLTQDRDFGALLALTGADGPSVVYLRYEQLPDTAEQARQIVTAVREHADALRRGALVVVEDSGVRLAPLPLRRQE